MWKLINTISIANSTSYCILDCQSIYNPGWCNRRWYYQHCLGDWWIVETSRSPCFRGMLLTVLLFHLHFKIKLNLTLFTSRVFILAFWLKDLNWQKPKLWKFWKLTRFRLNPKKIFSWMLLVLPSGPKFTNNLLIFLLKCVLMPSLLSKKRVKLSLLVDHLQNNEDYY